MLYEIGKGDVPRDGCPLGSAKEMPAFVSDRIVASHFVCLGVT